MKTRLWLWLSGAMLLCVFGTQGVAGPQMWVCDAAGNLGRVDVVTGSVTTIGNLSVQLTDLAFAPNGDLYGISFRSLYRVNRLNATVIKMGDHGISSGLANALTFGRDGVLYAADDADGLLYTLNPSNGVATVLGYVGFRSAGDLAFHNEQLYLASSLNRLIRISLTNGVAGIDVGAFGRNDVYGLGSGSDGVFYAVADTQVLTVDPLTGATTPILNYSGFGLGTAFGIAFETEAAPTPIIVTQPSNATVMVGATASFSVEAAGGLPLSCQWRRQGTNLVDGGNFSGVATTNLLIGNVQLSDAAGYSVVVTNAYGSTTSRVAQLTVTLPPNPGRFANFTYSPVMGFTFIFRDATVGKPYRIQVSDSLAGGWLDWQSFTYNGPVGFLDFSAAGTTNRFYRAVSP